MKKFLKAFLIPANTKGFTLIELLVVIGILGIMASALVATIDPFEQLKKGQDAKVKNMVVEFYNANLRYYTTHNSMPWHSTSVTTGGCYNAATEITLNLTGARMQGCLTELITEGELKQGFTTVQDDLSKITVHEADNKMTVCFNPQSKSQRKAPDTKYNQWGDANTACPADLPSCYWCTQ